MLEEMGHDVADAASGRVALEHLKAGRACDLLLVDFAMPVMDGSACAADARILSPTVPACVSPAQASNIVSLRAL